MTVAGKRYVDCTAVGGAGDAEDSSYDSDFEAEEAVQPEGTVGGGHADVSRTTSDTLAAEFAEYVVLQDPAANQSPGYTARVEFALKLGYTERLVQAALRKLGPDPGQNELLAELIKLGATAQKTDAAEEPDPAGPDSAEEELPGATPPRQSPASAKPPQGNLRPVVIDGSNVAMSHGNKEVFSCRGIRICVDWFRMRGHKEITVFVPKWRKEASRLDNPIADQEILGELERDRLLVFTPSRLVGGKRMVCYDDRYILRLAAEVDGIVVSNDNYRDLAQESPEFRKVVEERILMYSFVNDRFMPPDDPLGRGGPTLENFLRLGSNPAPPCPYAKKCTYGNKCKFRHPERGPHPHKSVTERLVEHAQKHLQARGPSLSLPLPLAGATHQPLCKTRSAAGGQPLPAQPLAAVPKSRSVENVTEAPPTHTPAPGHAPVTAPVAAVSGAQHPMAPQNPQGYRSSGRQQGRPSNPEPEPANMHRKLQRQLTLNPACDPRLYHLRRLQTPPPPAQAGQSAASTSRHHRPLARHASTEGSYAAPPSWEHQPESSLHQHVTRIASAPDSYHQWPPQSASPSQRLGTSEPQLNLVAGSLFANTRMLNQFLDTRTRIHYHLANIFPEEDVRAAMAIHPFETDPKEICAAVLKMYRQ